MTLSTKDFRSELFSQVQAWGAANFPTMTIVYENGPTPDQDAIGSLWLDISIRWYGGEIAALGESPRLRQTGSISAGCYYKTASGTGQSDDVVDSLNNFLAARRVGGAILLAPQRTVPTDLIGWYRTGVLIPFILG